MGSCEVSLTQENPAGFYRLFAKINPKGGVAMFLNQLNQKEKEMLQEYCREMGLDSFDIKDAVPMEDVLRVFKQSELHIKQKYFI